ncbi:MAG: glycosyltransferase family A protein [Candidatus Moranbacteria bacterium]|nr:glycosyltransferase family A protein [Candidatus Moranbacteria bacterium]
MIPKISVVIPCYNYGEYIEETVESVLAQTFRDYEIIIVDDGSTDQYTLDILDKIGKEHPEIKIVYQFNGHLSNARNNGIKASRGEFFLPLDADDIIEPTMLEKCYEMISSDPKLGFIYTYTHFFGTENSIWKNQEYNFYDLLWANHPTVCALVRKKAWEEAGGYDENMKDGYEDWEFWIRLGKLGWFGKVVKESLFNYRRHGESMLSGTELKHYEIIKYIRTKHKDIYARASLAKIKRAWNPKGSGGVFRNLGAKLKGAGLSNAELWKKHPLKALGRCIPIRIKRKINSIFKKRIFDTSYYRRSGG